MTTREQAEQILSAAGIENQPPARERPQIEVGTGPGAIRALRGAIDSGVIPDTYVSGGQVVHVGKVSGADSGARVDEDSPLPVTASEIGPSALAALLAEHTYTYRAKSRRRENGDDESYKEETTPTSDILRAALALTEWPNLPVLHSIVGAPVLRPDGSLLQTPGYDKQTGFYLASKVTIAPVPDVPSSEQAEKARAFVLDRFLGDFPWVGPADKANGCGSSRVRQRVALSAS